MNRGGAALTKDSSFDAEAAGNLTDIYYFVAAAVYIAPLRVVSARICGAPRMPARI